MAPPKDDAKARESAAAERQRTQQRRRPHGDLDVAPALDDAEYGEHAAAFLSGRVGTSPRYFAAETTD